jgi:hypothetical protein
VITVIIKNLFTPIRAFVAKAVATNAQISTNEEFKILSANSEGYEQLNIIREFLV